ncbi:mitochondrial cardiolipin hydrolase isoform X3 [Microcebus murinus]|uniref:mitochondrial cardiolipin hydrolase isoform X3 n=1 Tax=Microcebus murinus TaxID=30608 RepID=UPI003F6C30DE
MECPCHTSPAPAETGPGAPRSHSLASQRPPRADAGVEHAQGPPPPAPGLLRLPLAAQTPRAVSPEPSPALPAAPPGLCPEGPQPAFRKLESRKRALLQASGAADGIQVRHDQDLGYMHHKFAIVDKKVLITGSLNWTTQAIQNNRENVLIMEDEECACSEYFIQVESYNMWPFVSASFTQCNVFMGNPYCGAQLLPKGSRRLQGANGGH